MTLIIDAAPLIALADSRDPQQRIVAAILMSEHGELVIPAPVATEVDYLLGARLGRPARIAFLDDLAAGRFTVACLELENYRAVAQMERTYADLDVGLADLSVVIMADRYGTDRVMTFDERHFRPLRSLSGKPLTLLPADDTPGTAR